MAATHSSAAITSLVLPAPVRVEHLERDDVDLGRHAEVGLLETRGRGAAAGDDAGDVRAVTEVVVRLRATVDEVDELADADAGRSACGCTPESMTATAMPRPVCLSC